MKQLTRGFRLSFLLAWPLIAHVQPVKLSCRVGWLHPAALPAERMEGDESPWRPNRADA